MACERLIGSTGPQKLSTLNSSPPLTQHVQKILRHLVGGRDDLGVRRIGLLSDDQLGEFVGDVDVRRLERSGRNLPGGSEYRRTGFVGHREGAAVESLKEI